MWFLLVWGRVENFRLIILCKGMLRSDWLKLNLLSSLPFLFHSVFKENILKRWLRKKWSSSFYIDCETLKISPLNFKVFFYFVKNFISDQKFRFSHDLCIFYTWRFLKNLRYLQDSILDDIAFLLFFAFSYLHFDSHLWPEVHETGTNLTEIII